MLEGGGGTQCKSYRFYYVPMIFSLDSCSQVSHILLSNIQLMFIELHAGPRVVSSVYGGVAGVQLEKYNRKSFTIRNLMRSLRGKEEL